MTAIKQTAKGADAYELRESVVRLHNILEEGVVIRTEDPEFVLFTQTAYPSEVTEALIVLHMEHLAVMLWGLRFPEAVEKSDVTTVRNNALHYCSDIMRDLAGRKLK